MGRKIPGKKHRTIKDPGKQQQARYESVKNKINNPPRNPHVQEIPKSLLNLMALKKAAKKSNQRVRPVKKSKRKKKRLELLSVAKVLDKYPFTKSTGYIPNLKQEPGEMPSSFLRRMKLMSQSMIEEVEFEKKFNVQIQKNEETGEVIEVKKLPSKKRSKKKKLHEKRKEKQLKKKENLHNFKDFSQLKDEIKFGEVVERPPTLPAIKPSKNMRKPAPAKKYENLILNQKANNKAPGKSAKSSQLEKEKAENERKFIVEAYRKAKSKR